MLSKKFVFIVCFALFSMLILPFGPISAETVGVISGTVKTWKTKVKTAGPKSYKDVVIYLEKVGDNNFPTPSKHLVMDQRGMVFIPHVLVIQKGTTVDFLNNDNELHNVYCMDLGTWPQGETRSFTFNNPGVGTMLCKKHLEMAAYVVVLENPYFTVVELDKKTQSAEFTINNVPPGEYILKTWHKKLKLKGGGQKVSVEEGKTATITIDITKSKYAKKK
jgi:plastocyanin